MRTTTARQLFLAGTLVLTSVSIRGESIPARLTDKEFWQLVTSVSESGGYFRSDNFVSNETSFQRVIPRLQQQLARGGVYLGVGPDQNFTYVVGIQPKIAIIFDIRRQNMLQHLMYKAIIEMSRDRQDFLSLLFSRPRPDGVPSAAIAESLFAAFARETPDSLRYAASREAIHDRLTKEHGFTLSAEDLQSIDYVFYAFFVAGQELNYSFGRGTGGFYGRRGMPSYEQLMVATDENGVNRSYLANEENFRILKELEERNLIVPVVGDFAGDHAIRTVSAWLKERKATVSAFYTSNVEQYLFQGTDSWRRFYDNVATLPVDSASTFIRAFFNFGGFTPGQQPGMRSATMLFPIVDLLKSYSGGELQSYYDLFQLSLRYNVPGVD